MAPFGGFGQAVASIVPTPVEPSTPWMAASDGNLGQVQQSLATLQLQPSAADPNGYTLVHAAAAYNQTHVLEWLLSTQVCDANAQDSDGDTPLHHVEHVAAATFLVERMQANASLKNNELKSALQERYDELQEQAMDPDEDEDEGLKELVEYLKGVTTVI